jgi:hypothetical protein
VLALDVNRDKDTRINIERYREEVNNFVINIISKFALVRLFLLGHKLVYNAGKSVYNSALKFCLVFKCIELATNGL